jgi:hypothetical protein
MMSMVVRFPATVSDVGQLRINNNSLMGIGIILMEANDWGRKDRTFDTKLNTES